MFFEKLYRNSYAIKSNDKMHIYKQFSLLKITKGSFHSDFLRK